MPSLKRSGAESDDHNHDLSLELNLAAAATAAAVHPDHGDPLTDDNAPSLYHHSAAHSADLPPAHKFQRTEEDAARNAKKKHPGSSRTGQACDRCKTRKIRCDARPGGCSPCRQNNTECKTTDRITGRATSRGHTENVETENTNLRMYVIELQQQLRDAGVEPKSAPNSGAFAPSTNAASFWPPTSGTTWELPVAASNAMFSPSSNVSAPTAASATSLQTEQQHRQQASSLEDLRAGCMGDYYLGVSSEANNWLSSVDGMSVALFGTKIDVSSFMPPIDSPFSAEMSYATFLDYAFGRIPPFIPKLPPVEQCRIYADWFFRSMQRFFPILHKPDFMRLLDRVLCEAYQPTAAENAMIHMVLASICYQFSVRNGNEQARHDAMSYYHYALSFVPNLLVDHKLENIQALTLICCQMRNQPRPGGAWMFTNTVFGLAIESGLHRSAKNWPDSFAKQDLHHLEMRKRTFWGLFMLHVHISGRLGRPMALRLEDIDIECPEAVHDNLDSEVGLSDWRKCSFRAAIEGVKLLQIGLQIYTTVYSVRSTGQYEDNLRNLEKQLDHFQAQVPPELQGGIHTKDDDRVCALYLELAVSEYQLLLHHPSLCRSMSPRLVSGNLDACLAWTTKMCTALMHLKALKSLDATWFTCGVHIGAVFTSLFIYNARQDQLVPSDVQKLSGEMEKWCAILGDLGPMLGTGAQLETAMRNIIFTSVDDLSRRVTARTSSTPTLSSGSTALPESVHSQQQHNLDDSNDYDDYNHGHNNNVNDMGGQQPSNSNYQDHGQTSYSNSNNYAQYAETPATSIAFNPNNVTLYDESSYAEEDLKSVLAAATAAAGHPQPAPSSTPSSFMPPPPTPHSYNNPSPQSQGSSQYPSTSAVLNIPHAHHHPQQHMAFGQSGAAAWRNFTHSMSNNMVGLDYLHQAPAGALMALSTGLNGTSNHAKPRSATSSSANVTPPSATKPTSTQSAGAVNSTSTSTMDMAAANMISLSMLSAQFGNPASAPLGGSHNGNANAIASLDMSNQPWPLINFAGSFE